MLLSCLETDLEPEEERYWRWGQRSDLEDATKVNQRIECSIRKRCSNIVNGVVEGILGDQKPKKLALGSIVLIGAGSQFQTSSSAWLD